MSGCVAVHVGEGAEEIYWHIRECDRMYHELFCNCDWRPQSTACRRLLKLGLEIDYAELPRLCLEHCERWRLPEAPGRPESGPHAPVGPSAPWGNPRGFSNGRLSGKI